MRLIQGYRAFQICLPRTAICVGDPHKSLNRDISYAYMSESPDRGGLSWSYFLEAWANSKFSLLLKRSLFRIPEIAHVHAYLNSSRTNMYTIEYSTISMSGQTQHLVRSVLPVATLYGILLNANPNPEENLVRCRGGGLYFFSLTRSLNHPI